MTGQSRVVFRMELELCNVWRGMKSANVSCLDDGRNKQLTRLTIERVIGLLLNYNADAGERSVLAVGYVRREGTIKDAVLAPTQCLASGGGCRV